ncbi:MAG TPA: GspE/PulE family protein, partial [Balneolales bacterium]|nr:GspE/PulE family protein [Balneolales bacterium]
MSIQQITVPKINPAVHGSVSSKKLFDGSVVSQVNTIIHNAVNMKASDIHLEPYEESFRLRYRLDGVLQKMGELSPLQKDAILSRIKIMAKLDIAEKRRPQDGRIRIEKDKKTVDLRVSTLPTEFGEKIVLRILDKSEQRLELRQLGFDETNLSEFRKAISNPYGMILVTGPTGSGKTTTLYAALSELNTPEVNITTIEDPIEYNLPGINQTQVRSDIGLTFSAALRAILRQDPNIIMVGEVRDKETAEIAIRSALTGHLVFSTLHTNDAPSAITRLIDMGIEPFLVASSVRLVMAQRLVRRICSQCKTEYNPEPEVVAELGLQSQHKFFHGSSCERCNGTGFKGRVALIELMPVSDALSELVVKESGAHELKKQALAEGMVTLRQSGVEKVKEGVTTVEEVIRETT